MGNYTWKHLNNIQIGRYAEYFVKMELTLYGLEIYSSDIDDRGIDFVAKSLSSRYYDFQVKSVRNNNYIFFQKSKFVLRDNLIASIVLFIENQKPLLYLIPSISWQKPDQLLVSRDYEGKKSKPEWGINLSKRNLNLLEKFRIEQTIKTIK